MKPSGERPPITALVAVAAMVAVYLMTPAQRQLGAAEILRDGPSPAAPYRKPDVEALLSGRECIPLRRLLENRPIEPVHTYSRPVACEGGSQ